ncbi:MAG TPA: hypothetical protein VMZ11_06900 [Mycobacteriales bacterium]|nr:hypothetical protein [Mycobacteriales bacterium]
MRPLTLVLPVLLLAACGGGGSGLAKSDYVAKAEAVCKDANTQANALSPPSTPAGFQDLVEKTVRIFETATDKLEALDPPKDDKAELQKKVIEPLDKQVVEAKKFLADVKAAVKKNDQKELGRLLQNPPTQAKADLDWMRSYGFKECVEAAKTDG